MSELTVNFTEEILDITVPNDSLNVTVVEEVLSVTETTDGLDVSFVDETLDVVIGSDLEVTFEEETLNVSLGEIVEINNYYTSGGKLTVEFDHTDFGATKTIGEITSGRVIINTVVEVDTAFDSGSFTIGKDSAQAILMTIADRGNAVNRYLTHNYIELTTTDNYKIFFSGSPTQGSGKVYITFA